MGVPRFLTGRCPTLGLAPNGTRENSKDQTQALCFEQRLRLPPSVKKGIHAREVPVHLTFGVADTRRKIRYGRPVG